MRDYRLADDFINAELERTIIAAVAGEPGLYWELLDTLPADAFAVEREAWEYVAGAIETEQLADVAPDWTPASNPGAAAALLADLYQRRLLAGVQERLAQAVWDETRPASELATLLEEEAARVQTSIRETQAGQLTWASDIIPSVLQDASARRRQRETTGAPVMGLPTGLGGLDRLLGGLEPGLTLLAGPPGVGKTTLALQIAASASVAAPVIFVTFENSPANLTLKGIAACAGVNTRDVQRGWADLDALAQGARDWAPVANRLALVEGTGRLTAAQLRALALRGMARHKAETCLIVVDYLQLWAKAAADLRGFATVRERVETLGASLRELAMRLDAPVLALASQNRTAGDYGNGKGTPALDSLKESGDLEYAADVVIFLTPAKERQATPPARAVDVTIAKHRNADTGRLELIYRPDVATIREAAKA